MGWGGLLGTIGGFALGGPLGGVIGGGLGGMIGGHGGKPDGNPEDPYTAVLGRSAAHHENQGRELSQLGATDLTPVINYFKQVTSQNPQAIMQATAPERARVIDQYDTARRALTSFGPASGGAVSANAQSQFDQAESLANVTSQARTNAMSGAAALGTSLTGLGLSADQLASTDLNTIINSILAREGLDTQKRGQNMQLAGSIGETIGTLVGIGMGGGGSV